GAGLRPGQDAGVRAVGRLHRLRRRRGVGGHRGARARHQGRADRGHGPRLRRSGRGGLEGHRGHRPGAGLGRPDGGRPGRRGVVRDRRGPGVRHRRSLPSGRAGPRAAHHGARLPGAGRPHHLRGAPSRPAEVVRPPPRRRRQPGQRRPRRGDRPRDAAAGPAGRHGRPGHAPPGQPPGRPGAVGHMLTLPDNFICRPYRGVSVQHWHDGPLEEGAVRKVLLTREAYRRTEYVVLRGAEGTALVGVTCSAQDELFNPIVGVEWLAGPDDCAYVVRHDVDSANATALAGVAAEAGGGAAVCVVEGLYQHVNFIVRANPVPVRLIDVVPPDPPRLFDLARQAIAIDEDLPPVRLEPELLDVGALAAEIPSEHYLLPCQGAGLSLAGTVDYLDQRPPRGDWTLVG